MYDMYDMIWCVFYIISIIYNFSNLFSIVYSLCSMFSVIYAGGPITRLDGIPKGPDRYIWHILLYHSYIYTFWLIWHLIWHLIVHFSLTVRRQAEARSRILEQHWWNDAHVEFNLRKKNYRIESVDWRRCERCAHKKWRWKRSALVGVRARQHEDRQSFAEQWCGRHVERQYWGDGERDASELNWWWKTKNIIIISRTNGSRQ